MKGHVNEMGRENRTSVAAEVGLVGAVLAVSFAFAMTRTHVSNRHIICCASMMLGAVCFARAFRSAPRPAWSKTLEAILEQIRIELATISIEEAKARALQYLADGESGVARPILLPSKDRTPIRHVLPAGVRDIFSRYHQIEWPSGIARIGVDLICPSRIQKDCTVIGYMFANQEAELAVRGDAEAVYHFDRAAFGAPPASFPSVYHWILYRKAVEETPFEGEDL